jgi:hypothetical protein
MDALHGISRGPKRCAAREEATQTAAQTWLARQGQAHGFDAIGDVVVDGYDRVQSLATAPLLLCSVCWIVA